MPPTARAGAPEVLCFGTYDRSVGRNAVILESLAAAGVPTHECHVPLWADTTDKLRAVRGHPARLASRQARAWWRLAAAYPRAGPYDVMLVGATAHLDLPLARALASAAVRPLVFDPLVSALETVRDRRVLPDGTRLRALGALERALLRLPDRVWLDTRAHAAALERELGLDPSRVAVIPAGAPAVFRRLATAYDARLPSTRRPMRVLYFGQYIPLHGIDVVLAAASLLRDEPDIVFEMVGRGQELPAALRLAERLGLDNVRFVSSWLAADTLARDHIAAADVCLGIFGSEPKATRVVPFKVYTALASGRAVVTADTPAVAELLRRDVEALVVPAEDPAALADALRALARQPGLRARLAALGQVAYDTRFCPDALGRLVLAELAALSAASRHADHGPRHAWRTDALTRQLVRHAPSGTLLDAGCGDGHGALRLVDMGRRVIALDRDLPRLRAARLAVPSSLPPAPGPAFVCADLTALPLAPGSVSGALAGEVLEHLADDDAATRELCRVLAPGGTLAVSVPAAPARWSAADDAVGHQRRYDRAGLARTLQAGGLAPVAFRGWGLPFGRLYDRLVLRPAMAARHSRARGPLARLGRARLVHRLWRALFRFDERFDAGELGSGWWAIARRPDAPRAGPRPPVSPTGGRTPRP